MRVLFYNSYIGVKITYFPVLLELIQKHKDAGDEISMLDCDTTLPFCEMQSFPKEIIRCKTCTETRENGFKFLNIENTNRYWIRGNRFVPDLKIPAFSTITELKNLSIDGVDIGSSVVSYFITSLRETNFDLEEQRPAINEAIKSGMEVFYSVLAYLDKIKPDLLYVFNARPFTLRCALRASQRAGINCFVYEFAGILSRYYISNNTFPHDLEYSKLEIDYLYEKSGLSPIEKKITAKNYFMELRSNGLFNRNQKENLLPEKFDISKRTVGIFISSEDEFESIDIWKNTFFIRQNEVIERLAIDFGEKSEFQFIVRIHPNLKELNNSQVKTLMAFNFPNLIIIPAESPVDSYYLMEKCEKVVVFGSTMGIESVFWGIPAILAGRAYFEGVNSCYKASSYEELKSMIMENLEPCSKEGAYRFGFWESKRGNAYKYFDYKKETFKGYPVVNFRENT